MNREKQIEKASVGSQHPVCKSETKLNIIW